MKFSPNVGREAFFALTYIWSREKSRGKNLKMKENEELVANLPWMA